MEAVIDALVNVARRGDVVGLQPLLEIVPSGIDPVIEAGIVQQQRRLDLRSVGGGRLGAIERNTGGQVWTQAYGQRVDHPASATEADRADFAGAIRAAFEPARRSHEIFR